MKHTFLPTSLALVSTALVVSIAGAKLPTAPQISLEQFRQEVQNHRSRVLADAQEAFHQFSNEFPALMSLPQAVRERLFETYMKLHDAPKVMTERQLRGWGYKDAESILEKLHGVYGVNLTERPWYINELNAIEAELKRVALQNKFQFLEGQFKAKVEEELKYIEWIADITDTLHTRGTELGAVFDAESAERYFLARGEKRAAKISHWLGIHRYHIKSNLCHEILEQQ